jgi:mannose-6-phosphate isomerase-like protein (cupin superfamily)
MEIAQLSETPSGYTPSPRPTYDAPTLVRRIDVKRHIWGDRESQLVADWLYASTDKLHVLMFGLAPGKCFKHSSAFRTVFRADEVLYVLSGSMLASNPQTGEVVSFEAGQSLFFQRDTWHHVRAQGNEPLRVLEFFAPPPSQGTSGPYAVTRPYVDAPRYTRDNLIGDLPRASAPSTLHRVERRDHSMRLEGDIAIGLIASTAQLTVAELDIPAGGWGQRSSHGGDAMVFGLKGELMIRTYWNGTSATFEMGPHDAVFMPHRAEYEVLSFSSAAKALMGVAPAYLP